MTEDKITSCRIKESTKKRVQEKGVSGESIDTILARVLDENDECQKRKGKLVW